MPLAFGAGMRDMSPLTIQLLGKPTVSYEGQLLTFRTRKVLALLIYLVVDGGAKSRESLMTVMWPERTATSAATTLRGTLSRLRKSLQPAGDFLIVEGDSVSFDFEASFDLDLAWLAAAARSEYPPDGLQTILSVDRGEFLTGFSLPDAPDFLAALRMRRSLAARSVPARSFKALSSSP